MAPTIRQMVSLKSASKVQSGKLLESLDPESSISCRSTYIHGEIPLDTLVDIFVETLVGTLVGTLIERLL